jgi:hypothetical protein
MATTPDPIEGWTFTCEWKTDKHADGLKWKATDPGDNDVSVCIEDGALSVFDRMDYYPSGSYSVPLAVIDALRRLAAESVDTLIEH